MTDIETAELVVYGQPAPQGSKSFMGVKGGRGILVESSKKVKPWRQDVKAAAEAFIEPLRPWTPLDGPLVARMVFTMRKPASAPKRRTTYPDRIPDLSKLVRSTEDALVEAGLLKDDARIVKYVDTAKVFPGEGEHALDSTGAHITIWTMARYLAEVEDQVDEPELLGAVA
jgi:Holliday junction resolvase RusA-like endonuclease